VKNTDALKRLQADVPQTSWGKVLNATPVVMTVVATLLAGLSSSEMTRAQYDRSLAAQQQAKAGDQWGLFQAKRLRSTVQQTTLDSMELAGSERVLSGAELSDELRESLKNTNDPQLGQAIDVLVAGKLPDLPHAEFSPEVQQALQTVEDSKPDEEVDAAIAQLTAGGLQQAVQAQKDAVRNIDVVLEPSLRSIEALVQYLNSYRGDLAPDAVLALRRGVAAARLAYQGRRYETEARVNQRLANLFELQVRRSNMTADRHYLRSQRFFYGMLAAQFSVIMSTFAIAVKMRTTLWTLAAVVGLFAVVLAAYVYLWL
jgi:Domain of unknown function (DUF4337)